MSVADSLPKVDAHQGGPPVQGGSGITYIVPTLRRPEFLRRCLSALAAQQIPPEQVLVGVHAEDALSTDVIADFTNTLPVRAVEVRGVGVVGSMNSCLLHANSEFVALVDDDVELPRDWAERMMRHLKADECLLAVGGRDFLQDDPELRRVEARTLDVGRFHWYGRITGDHHRGAGVPRHVDILRGSNCLVRGDFLRQVGFEKRLRGAGAQVHWELALALQARRRGGKLLYDPTVEVLHHVAVRHDADQLHRGGFNAGALEDMVYNETLVLELYAPSSLRLATFLWGFLVGGGFVAGPIKALQLLYRGDPHVKQRVAASARGRIAAVWDASRLRRQSRGLQ